MTTENRSWDKKLKLVKIFIIIFLGQTIKTAHLESILLYTVVLDASMAISKTKIRFLFETIIRKFNFPAYDRIFTKITEVAYLSENSICTIEGKFRIPIV